MNAGRELDAQVAEKVMGYEVNKDSLEVRIDPHHLWTPVEHYSTWLASAMKLAFHLQSRGYEFEIFVGHVSPGAFCGFRKSVEEHWSHHEREGSRESALCLAICKTALKAVGA